MSNNQIIQIDANELHAEELQKRMVVPCRKVHAWKLDWLGNVKNSEGVSGGAQAEIIKRSASDNIIVQSHTTKWGRIWRNCTLREYNLLACTIMDCTKLFTHSHIRCILMSIVLASEMIHIYRQLKPSSSMFFQMQ